MWQPIIFVTESGNTVPQQKSEVKKGTPLASSQTRLTSLSDDDDDDDEPCEISGDPLGEPTRGTDEEEAKVSQYTNIVRDILINLLLMILTLWCRNFLFKF
jgi:hypothetical protein